MDTDKDSVSEEFLIICKHCEEILPSFRAFLQHKQERHSDTDQGSPKITSAAAEATATGATPTGTLNQTDPEEGLVVDSSPILTVTPSPEQSLIKIKFPFNKKPIFTAATATVLKLDHGDHDQSDSKDEMIKPFPVSPLCISNNSTPPPDRKSIHEEKVNEEGTPRPPLGEFIKAINLSSRSESDTKAKATLKIRGKKKGQKRKQWSLVGHRCSYCAEIFNNLNEKRRHEWIHTKPFGCSVCYKGFSSKAALRAHAQLHNDRSKQSMEKTQTEKSKKKVKVMDRSSPPTAAGSRPPRIFKCEECPYQTLHSKGAKHHKKLHTEVNPHKCPVCTCSYPSARGLTRHLGRVHPDSEQTKTRALEQPKTKPKMRQPKTKPRIRPCSVCTKMIAWNRMVTHRKLFHPEVLPFDCADCPHTTHNWECMWRHRKHHVLQLPIKCPHCTASYTTVTKCNTHIQHAHPTCELLPVPALDKIQIKVNKTKKSIGVGCVGTKSVKAKVKQEYKCKYCGKEENGPGHLERHEAIHTLPFHCSQCPRRFSKKYYLMNHTKGHRLRTLSKSKSNRSKNLGVGVGPGHIQKEIRCPACGENVNGRAKLEQHLKIYHPSFKAYKCQDCAFATAKHDILKAHVRFHRGGDAFPCPHCTASFPRMIGRDRHVIDVHPGMPTTAEISPGPKQQRRASVHPTGYYNPKDEPLPVELVEGGNQFKCHICDREFERVRRYEEHFRKNHPGTKPYKCKVCPYETISSRTMDAHEKVHTESNEFKCDSCTASFTSRIARTMHIVLHVDQEEGGNKNSAQDTIPPLMSGENATETGVDEKKAEKNKAVESTQPIHPAGTENRSHGDGHCPSPPLQLTCDICFKSFPFNIALRVHRERVHSADGQGVSRSGKPLPLEVSQSLGVVTAVTPDKQSISNTSTFPSEHSSKEEEIEANSRIFLVPWVNLERIDVASTESSKCSEINDPPSTLPTNQASISEMTDLPPMTVNHEALPSGTGTADQLPEPSRVRTRKSTATAHGLISTFTPPPKRKRYEKLFVCTICNARFSGRTDLETHAASKCEETQKEEAVTANQPEVYNQETQEANPPSSPVEQQKENKDGEVEMVDTSEVTEHVGVVEKPLCPICQTTFAFPTQLKIHMKKAHAELIKLLSTLD